MTKTKTKPDNQDTLLGKLVVQHGLATAEEVYDCQEFQRELLSHRQDISQQSLGDLLVSNGILTQRQLDRLHKHLLTPSGTQQIPGFQIIKKVGVGAMATVYLAKQLSLDRMVAIKILPPRHTNHPQFVNRFYAEGRAAAKLNHPNIVSALDVGKAGGFHYFVMEYVEGRTVLDDLIEYKRYSEQEALQIATQIASALDHAHKAGLIHRDVKPKNIIITPQGVAKLADMGLARLQTDREEAEAEKGKAFGTPYYISPEQIRGQQDIDFRADIYCFGATLYHMVTGQVPFEGPNPSAVMQRHLKKPLTPPLLRNPKLSQGLASIVEVCLAKDPNQRYPSTYDLLEDLKAVAQGRPTLIADQRYDPLIRQQHQEVEQTGAPTMPTLLPYTPPKPKNPIPLHRQPLFWIALAGWAASIALIVSMVGGSASVAPQ